MTRVLKEDSKINEIVSNTVKRILIKLENEVLDESARLLEETNVSFCRGISGAIPMLLTAA